MDSESLEKNENNLLDIIPHFSWKITLRLYTNKFRPLLQYKSERASECVRSGKILI